MKQTIRKLDHGRETYAVNYNDFVMKRPLPGFSDSARDKWLEKQIRTQCVIKEISAIGNCAYNVPQMHFINTDEYSILEQRAPGAHLTGEVYRKLSRRQQTEIIYGIASFLVDMNELKPVKPVARHKIIDEFKFDRLVRTIDNKMPQLFNKTETLYMARICNDISQFEYQTRLAWSHGDLNPTNVMYDVNTNILSFIDFAEADYKFIFHDIFSSLQMELGIGKSVYEQYLKLHNSTKYSLPALKNPIIVKIMKFRMITVLLKRFIKIADDIHINTNSDKGIRNNQNKFALMQNIIQHIQQIERQFPSR